MMGLHLILDIMSYNILNISLQERESLYMLKYLGFVEYNRQNKHFKDELIFKCHPFQLNLFFKNSKQKFMVC